MSSHNKQKIGKVYEKVYNEIQKKNDSFSYDQEAIKDDEEYFNCTFKWNGDVIRHFDLKQLICHFLAISAHILEDKKANKNIKFIYLIFDPRQDTNFRTDDIGMFENKIFDDYKNTIEEITKLDNLQWLFDIIFKYQADHLGLLPVEYEFNFELASQKDYKEKLEIKAS